MQKRLHLVTGLILLFLLAGCSRSKKDAEEQEFFAEWLRSHGETNIVTDANGVGIEGNATRLSSKMENSEKQGDGFTVETGFRVILPDGRQIVEFVAGVGKSVEAAEKDAKLNFVLSTFHVVYRSFINPADPHQKEESILIQGKPRKLLMGDIITRGKTATDSPEMFSVKEKFREILAAMDLSPGPHWMKTVYAQNKSTPMMCTVTLDNEANAALTEAVQKLPWPVQEDFYMVKQFTIVK